MARLLGAARPGYRRVCRYARRGCRCYLYAGEYGSTAKTLRRRANRAVQNRAWKAEALATD